MKLINIVLLFISYMNMFLLVRTIAESKNKKDSILYIVTIIFVIIMNTISSTMFDELYKGIITFLGFIFFSIVIKKQLSKETLVIAFISYMCLVIMETLFAVSFFAAKKGDFLKQFGNLGTGKLIFALVVSISMLIIINIRPIKNLVIKLKKRLTRYKFLVPIIILVSLSFEVSTIFTMMNTNNEREVILSFSLIILIAIGIGLLWYNIYQKNYLKLINENLMINNESFMNIINNYKMFKHNITSELVAIGEIGDKNVKKLVSTYLDEYKVNNKNCILNISRVPNGLRNLIYQKVLEHKDFRTNITVDNFLDIDLFDEISIKKICKLSQCVGIVFDNAIEASNLLEDGYIYLKFYKDKESDSYVVECQNNFNNHIEIDDYSKPIISKKEKHYGIGVSYLFKQKDITVKSNIINNNFIVKMYVK